MTWYQAPQTLGAISTRQGPPTGTRAPALSRRRRDGTGAEPRSALDSPQRRLASVPGSEHQIGEPALEQGQGAGSEHDLTGEVGLVLDEPTDQLVHGYLSVSGVGGHVYVEEAAGL